MTVPLQPIGEVRSPYQSREDCPANGWGSDTRSEIRLDPAFRPGLDGLNVGARVHVLWWFDEADREVICQPDEEGADPIGVFAMRSPERPNPIALSLCRIEASTDEGIEVTGLDAVDGSPVLDIKSAVNYDQTIL